MENEKLIEIVNYLGAENIVLTLFPALMLNVIIDMTKQILVFKNRVGEIIALNGILSFLGFIFGIIYYYALDIKLFLALTHSLVICFLSYLFYKIGIYDLMKRIIFVILKKFGIETNNSSNANKE